MQGQPGLGVLESGRKIAAGAGSAFDLYSQQLIAAREVFFGEQMSLSSIERLLERVKQIADAMATEADTLKARAQLVVVGAGETRGTIDTLIDSIIPPALIPLGHEDYPEEIG